jgi:LmbE family N-acetylglucosaminyl deacetylase
MHRLVRVVPVVLTLGLVLVPVCKRFARRACRWTVAGGLRLRSESLRPTLPTGPLLVISPHPDDETLGCGGLIASLRQSARRVEVAFVTDGAASHPDHPTLTPAKLAEIRHAEALAATAALGVPAEAVHFFDAPDGRLSHLDSSARGALVGRLATLLTRVQPTLIALPCLQDGSAEHAASFQLTQAALITTPLTPLVLEFPIWSWWNPLLLLRALFGSGAIRRLEFQPVHRQKLAALACYHSQIKPIPPATSPLLSADYVRAFQSPVEYFLVRPRDAG